MTPHNKNLLTKKYNYMNRKRETIFVLYILVWIRLTTDNDWPNDVVIIYGVVVFLAVCYG